MNEINYSDHNVGTMRNLKNNIGRLYLPTIFNAFKIIKH